MATSPMYTAWAEVAPDFSKFGRKVDKGFRDTMTPAGKRGGEDAGKGIKTGMLGAIGKMAAPLAAAFGALKIGGIIADSITQASDLQEAGTAIGQIFGDQAGAIQEFAKAGAGAFGENQIAVLRSAQSFGVYGKAAGLAGGDLTDFSTDMVGLSTDLASFFNTSTDEAANALAAGLRGESEPLRKFGVLLDDATLKARAMELGIYDGSGSLTQQQKILASQAEILAQTSDAQGDFSRTSGGLANQQKILAAGWSDIVTQMGAFFLPIATTVVSFLNSNVIPAIQNFLGALGGEGGGFAGFISGFADMRDSLIRNVAEAFPAILAAIVDGISSMIATVVDVLPGVVDAVVGMVPVIVSALVTAIPLLVQGALTLFRGIVDAVAILVPQLVTAVVGLIPTIVTALLTLIPLLIEGAIQLFTAVVEAIPLIIPPLINAIVELLPVIVEALFTLIPALIEGAVSLFIAIVEAVPIIVPQLIDAIVDLLPVILDSVISMIPLLIDSAVLLFTSLVKAIPVILPKLVDAIVKIGPKIVETIIGIVPKLFDAGKAIIQGLIDGIGSMIGAVGNAVGGIMDWIGGFFPHSPAERGPFSGAGWRAVEQSGAAVYEQFMSGFDGDDPVMPGVSYRGAAPVIRRPAALDDLTGTASRGGGDSYTFNGQYAMTAQEIGRELNRGKRRAYFQAGALVKVG